MVEQLQWFDLVGFLSSDKKHAVRTLDTIFNEPINGALSWYFTNKSGCVSKKKDHSTSSEGILDRFSRFALSNPCNTEGIIGVFVDLPAGQRILMKKHELEKFLLSTVNELSRKGTFLQVYLRPLRGADVLFACESRRTHDLQYEHEIIVVHQHHNADAPVPTGKHEVTEDIYNQITSFSESIIACMRESRGLHVDGMTIECIVDDNQQAWVSSVSQCEVTTGEPDNTDYGESVNIEEHTASPQHEAHQRHHHHHSSGEGNAVPAPAALPAQQPSPSKHYSSTTTASKPASKKDLAERKKAKKDLKTGDSGFKRSGVEAPPSIELLAKFAAEKERLLIQQQYEEEDYQYENSAGTGRRKPKGKEKGLKRSHSGNAAAGASSSSGNASGYLPSLHRQPDNAPMLDPLSHIDLAERHIEELQKRASAAAVVKSIVQQQHAAPLNAGSFTLAGARQPLGSAASASGRPGTHMGSAPYLGAAPGTRQAMSGSEAEFLVRQIHSATDLSQLSMFSNIDEFETVAAGLDAGGSMTGASATGLVAGGESIWSMDGLPAEHAGGAKGNQSSLYGTRGASVTEVMGDAFKEKISGLERQITQLNQSLARKESELEKKDVKLKKLAADMDIVKRDAALDLRRVTEEVSYAGYIQIIGLR
jgi:hypothetical protein